MNTYIVDVSILTIAAQVDGVGRVVEAEEVQTTHAALVTRLDADSNTVVGFLVYHDVVAATQRKGAVEVTSEVLGVIELNRGVLLLDVEELLIVRNELIVMLSWTTHLLHVEDLDTVALELTTNHHVVLVGADLGPVGTVGGGSELGSADIESQTWHTVRELPQNFSPYRYPRCSMRPSGRISIMAQPSYMPVTMNSRPESGSVQPQEELPDLPRYSVLGEPRAAWLMKS